jgi:hypothetical protein
MMSGKSFLTRQEMLGLAVVALLIMVVLPASTDIFRLNLSAST